MYKDGHWGEKAKERARKRVEAGYFKKRYKSLPARQRIGFRIPKGLDLSCTINLGACQICGSKESAGKWKGLLIHHIDENYKNNKITNLMLLCRGCHNSIHKKGKPR